MLTTEKKYGHTIAFLKVLKNTPHFVDLKNIPMLH